MTSPTSIWPAVIDNPALFSVLAKSAPAVTAVLEAQDMAWGLEMNLYCEKTPRLLSRMTWLSITDQQSLAARDVTDLEEAELLAMAQCANAARIADAVAQILPGALLNGNAAKEIAVAVTRHGAIVHARDMMPLSRDPGWAAAFREESNHILKALDGDRVTEHQLGASAALATFIPFELTAPSMHAQLMRSANARQVLTEYLAYLSQMIANEKRIALHEGWALTRP